MKYNLKVLDELSELIKFESENKQNLFERLKVSSIVGRPDILSALIKKDIFLRLSQTLLESSTDEDKIKFLLKVEDDIHRYTGFNSTDLIQNTLNHLIFLEKKNFLELFTESDGENCGKKENNL